MQKSTKVFLGFLAAFWAAFPVCARELVVCDDVNDPLTLDPHKEFSEKNHTILQQIYEGLVRFDPNGKVEPALAVSWERMDPLRVRFHLRQGVSFHNGEPFNAAAVKYSIDRYLDPATQFPAFGFISSLDKVEVVDDYTADILTKFPDGLLINRLAGFILIVPPEYVKANGETILSTAPVGTGAFKFEKWEKGRRLVLAANKMYWMSGYPKVDKLVFRFMSVDDQMDALLKGHLDLMTELPGTMTLRTLEGNPNLKIVKKFTYNTVVGPFNMDQPALKDVRIRRALNYAVNKEEMVRYDLLMNGRPIATTTMEGEEGHNATLRPYPYDPEKAKALLKEAGVGEKGLSLDVVVKEQGRRTVGILRDELSKVGVTLNIHYTNDANILKDIASKKWDMAFGNCSDPMVHSFFVQSIMFYSKSPFAIGHNPEYDALLEQMMVTLDPAQRQDLAVKLDSYLYDQALGIFTYQRLRTYAAASTLHFEPYVSGMPYYFRAFYGEPTKRVEDK